MLLKARAAQTTFFFRNEDYQKIISGQTRIKMYTGLLLTAAAVTATTNVQQLETTLYRQSVLSIKQQYWLSLLLGNW